MMCAGVEVHPGAGCALKAPFTQVHIHMSNLIYSEQREVVLRHLLNKKIDSTPDLKHIVPQNVDLEQLLGVKCASELAV